MTGKLFKQEILPKVCLQTVKAVALSLLLGFCGKRSASGDETTNENTSCHVLQPVRQGNPSIGGEILPQCGAPLPQASARHANEVAGNAIAATESIQTDWAAFFLARE